MTLKIGYAYEQVDVDSRSDGANEREVTGASRVELVRWLGDFFLNDLYKVQNIALTLNIAIKDETPENAAFIADLLFKGISKQYSCVTKLNLEPQILFTQAQYDQIDRKLNENKAALLIAPKMLDEDAEKIETTAAQQVTKPKENANSVWLNVLLAAGLSFVTILSFTSLLPALMISTSIGLGVGYLSSKRIQENVTLEPKHPTAAISRLYNQEEQIALARCELAQLVGYELTKTKMASTEFAESCSSEALARHVRCK